MCLAVGCSYENVKVCTASKMGSRFEEGLAYAARCFTLTPTHEQVHLGRERGSECCTLTWFSAAAAVAFFFFFKKKKLVLMTKAKGKARILLPHADAAQPNIFLAMSASRFFCLSRIRSSCCCSLPHAESPGITSLHTLRSASACHTYSCVHTQRPLTEVMFVHHKGG